MRKLSVWEDAWTFMQALREVRCERLGIAVLRETQPPERLNSMLSGAAKSLVVLAGEKDDKDAVDLLELAWEEYLRDEWAKTCVPPFPLTGFANGQMLSRCWAAVEKGGVGF